MFADDHPIGVNRDQPNPGTIAFSIIATVDLIVDTAVESVRASIRACLEL